MNTSVEQLFHELADLTLEARDRYYTEHEVDPNTREELEVLLALDRSSGDLLEADVNAAVNNALTRLETNNLQCGPYRLLDLLGRGGMGAVYLGERVDGEITLRVAVKLLHPGADTLQVRERFRAERQILASLAHPNIARLLDAGHREDGQPYLVMEYVEGKSIDSYTQGLSTRQVITLFLKVCSAVAYLHRNLVVHRDLKPGNILVTAEGEPKLLDFGIAKMLDLTLDATVTNLRVLTPGYASPEQVFGRTVTTTSDVYSMGAVLYKLLTGAPPRAFAGDSVGDIVRSFSANEITSPSKLVLSLNGDLEAIMMKALRNEPEERYATVGQLSDDLEDHLASRPIRARQRELWYRARKFVSRHWLPVGAVAVAVAGLAAGLLAANYQREIAQQRFAQIRQVATRFIELHDDVVWLPGSTKVREKMVATALDYLESLSASAGNDASLLAEIGMAYQKIATAQGAPGQPNLGRAEDALRSLRKAIVFETRAADRDPSYRVPVASFRTELAYLAMLNGNFPEARQNLEAAAALLEQLRKEKPNDPALLLLGARVATNRGDLGWYEDPNSDQVVAFRQAAELFGEHLRLKPDNTAKVNAVRSMGLLADALREAKRYNEALAVLRQSEPILQDLLAAEPDNPGFLRQKMAWEGEEGEIYDNDSDRSLGRPPEAAAAFRRRVATTQRLSAMDPNNASARLSLAISYFELSFPLVKIDPSEAVRMANNSVGILEQDLAKAPNDRLLRSRNARALRHLGFALQQTGDRSGAEKAGARAIAVQTQLVAESPSDFSEREQLERSRRFMDSLTLQPRRHRP